MKKELLLSALLLFSVTTVSAQEDKEVKPPYGYFPERYVIKKGDTLWGISGKFFRNPFDWQDIWKKNQFIVDPHWIYPGQTITLLLPTDQ